MESFMDKTKSELKELKFYFLDFIYVPRGNPYSNFMPEPFNGVEQLDGELYSASFFLMNPEPDESLISALLPFEVSIILMIFAGGAQLWSFLFR